MLMAFVILQEEGTVGNIFYTYLKTDHLVFVFHPPGFAAFSNCI